MKSLWLIGAFGAAAVAQLPAAAPVKPLTTAPIAYFEAKCARCHGPNGGFYEQNFAAKYDDAALKAVIKRMAEGPGVAPLSDADLAVQAAYHRAIAANAPFFSLTKVGPVVSGETTAEKVVAKVKGKVVPVKLKEGIWTVKLTSASQLKDLVLSNGPVTFRPAKEAFSAPPHQKNAG
jgi:cytochrome c553